jgi:8-oxo-dGTP pyrophosphatase MutT (NUDIX family)
MAKVAQALAARGLLSRWRNEIYRIGLADHGRCFFDLERAAVRFFGFTAQAVHMNGLVVRDGQICMWIARRSTNKPIDPGMLDNLTGGGIGADLGVEQTLVKECWEEAGIPAALASRAVRTGAIRVCREVPDGLHAEIIHMYDLELPADFEPVNQDGEVQEFRCVPLAGVAAELASDAPYTVDAGLVAIDCLRRKGVLPQ